MGEVPKVLDDLKPAVTLDVEDINCPLPLLRIKKNIAKLALGDILQVNGIPHNSLLELKGWCERAGHLFLGEKKVFGFTSFFIKKA